MMKKLIYIFLCAALCAVLTAACTSNKTSIGGRFEDIPAGTKLKLVPGGIHTVQEPVAETVVTADGFAFEPEIGEPRLFYIRAEDIRGGVSILIAPGEKAVVGGTFARPVVTGSKTHDEYDEKFTRPRAAMNKMHGDNQQKFADILSGVDGGDADAVAAARSSEEWLAAEQESKDFFRYMDEQIEKAVAGNAGTYWAPLLLLSHTAYLTPENERHYNMFSDEARNSFYGKAVAAEIFGISGQAPAFTAKDADGNEYSLGGLLTGNNYVLLDFWASWCGPCRRFVPTLKELALKYADKGLVVVSISTDQDRDAWLKALEEEQMPWPNLLDEGGISTDYGVSGIPSVFLVNPQGEIVFGKQNGQSVVEKLEKEFGE